MKRPVDQLLAHRRIRKALILVVVFSILMGLIIVPVERSAGNIQTIEDGLYWSITTVTGVGYGDLVPVTSLGRVLSALLQLSGVVFLGLLVTLVADVLNTRQQMMLWSRSFERFNELQEQIARLESKLHYLVREEAENTKKSG